MRNLFYFGLEPLKERYTFQLSEEWFPSIFNAYPDIDFIHIRGHEKTEKINVGAVLDAYGRGAYAMGQCQIFMKMIAEGQVKNNDIVYLQDFWTPGFESVMYMLDLYNIKIDLYSMLHAQSVDEYDFTHAMKDWMRPIELGFDKYHKGIFVGSTIHKQQLRQAGFTAPIHVVSLPLNKNLAQEVLIEYRKNNPLRKADAENFRVTKRNRVIYTSRFDKEKNPYFMLKVATEFLKANPDWEWVITTSADDFKSNIPGFVGYMKETARFFSRLHLMTNLTKEEYYDVLADSKIQFNSALQDYVSWTLLESTMFDCDVVYPEFRSFPEILDKDRMYKPFDVEDALRVLKQAGRKPRTHQHISDISDLGRRLEGFVMMNYTYKRNLEFNVWHEKELISNLLKNLKC